MFIFIYCILHSSRGAKAKKITSIFLFLVVVDEEDAECRVHAEGGEGGDHGRRTNEEGQQVSHWAVDNKSKMEFFLAKSYFNIL